MTASISLIVLVLVILYVPYRIGRWVELRRWTRGMQEAPATAKQVAFIERLANEIGIDPPATDGLTAATASGLIDGLLLRQRRGQET